MTVSSGPMLVLSSAIQTASCGRHLTSVPSVHGLWGGRTQRVADEAAAPGRWKVARRGVPEQACCTPLYL